MSQIEIAERVGKRVMCEGDLGTVRFIGEIPQKPGVWVGVEWDNPSRGKHDGSYDGVRYFSTSHSNGGSFVRENKVNFGVSFSEAVKRRYGEGADDGEIVVSGKVVEIIEARRSRFDTCLEVCLSGMEISTSNCDGEVGSLFPNVMAIDLSNNLLSDWLTVSEIVKQIPSLTSLTLSGNRLKFLADPNELCPSFNHISVLFMNRMCLDWQQVVLVASMMSNLTELHVCYNNITELNCSAHLPELFVSLQVLNLEGNHICQWETVMKLQHLPCLSMLILNSNQLSCVTLESPDCGFLQLQSLSLNQNLISSWQSINTLSSLPSLKCLRVKQNPVFETDKPFEARQQVIARIPQLTSLEGSKVSVKERHLAERYYLKRYASEWVATGANREDSSSQQAREFHHIHPVYSALVRAHGEPQTAHQPATTSSLKGSLLEIGISFPQDPSKTPTTKKLPATLTIQKLKGLIQRLSQVDASQLQLTYKEREDGPEYEMEDNMRPLSFYSVKSGDTVVVRW